MKSNEPIASIVNNTNGLEGCMGPILANFESICRPIAELADGRPEQTASGEAQVSGSGTPRDPGEGGQNEGRSHYVDENKGSQKRISGRSHYIYENTSTYESITHYLYDKPNGSLQEVDSEKLRVQERRSSYL
jgi:hypothetical protein